MSPFFLARFALWYRRNFTGQNAQSAAKFKRLLALAMISTSLLISACSPPDDPHGATLSHSEKKSKAPTETPIIVGDDSVTMSADYILPIKPSRYQPSLGLQGVVEPIKQTQFRLLQAVLVNEVLVKEGQHVEKDTPLAIVTPVLAELDEKNDRDNMDNRDNTDSSDNTDDQNSLEQATDLTTDPKKASAAQNHSSAVNNKAKSSEPDSNGNAQVASAEVLKNPTPTFAAKPIVILASYSGQIGKVNIKNGQMLDPQTLLITMGDDSDLRFVATLPLEAKPQLSIGQTVNFTADHLTDTFSGQVSQLQDSSQNFDELLVTVHVIKNDISRAKLRPNMRAAGRVDYGQIEVGTIVPLEGIHDVDLTPLQKPPYKPISPLPANVWIIKQDQRLTRQPVEVIEFDPSTKQYLVAGINNDSLICLAKLPIESAGKKVVVASN